jgi:hypothetical protein
MTESTIIEKWIRLYFNATDPQEISFYETKLNNLILAGY